MGTYPGPLGGIKGMYPESNTLPKQPYPIRSASPAKQVLGLVDYLFYGAKAFRFLFHVPLFRPAFFQNWSDFSKIP
jgi:hypothetical protein